MATEKEKMLAGEMYDATDPQLSFERWRARDLCKSLNETHDNEQELRESIIRELFGGAGDAIWMNLPFTVTMAPISLLEARSFLISTASS